MNCYQLNETEKKSDFKTNSGCRYKVILNISVLGKIKITIDYRKLFNINICLQIPSYL